MLKTLLILSLLHCILTNCSLVQQHSKCCIWSYKPIPTRDLPIRLQGTRSPDKNRLLFWPKAESWAYDRRFRVICCPSCYNKDEKELKGGREPCMTYAELSSGVSGLLWYSLNRDIYRDGLHSQMLCNKSGKDFGTCRLPQGIQNVLEDGSFDSRRRTAKEIMLWLLTSQERDKCVICKSLSEIVPKKRWRYFTIIEQRNLSGGTQCIPLLDDPFSNIPPLHLKYWK